MMKFAAWQYLEGISFPLKNWIYGLFVGVSNTLSKYLLSQLIPESRLYLYQS